MVKPMKSYAILCVLLALMLALAGCGTKPDGAGSHTAPASESGAASREPGPKVELTVSAAASLTDALKEIRQAYESRHPDIKLNLNFGASGALQKQIEQGAPADLFLSASVQTMKALVDKHLIDKERQTDLLANELVVVVPADGNPAVEGVQELRDLAEDAVQNVAIGIPESVPAGSYAKEALENANLWESLQSKTVQAKDVRQVLQYVETGNADAGFVYKTDALTSGKAKIAFAVDPNLYTPIVYPAGVVKETKHPREAEDFYMYLQTKEALDVFVQYGFSVPSKT
ncbi:MAG: molybdate ABC transporter substrate-binding protein [Cohnella sp.]|uniref:molybdate ABC transporter substrate-binding protein n=1 Tax=Cohnella sp. TaxID=1883426 RepID=UPI000E3705A0|nr:molybdate ABC transporter substrate-binding protein [Cohnella sp.]REK63473.1 MAG: molybdate ABC transporter substrate-binding protein [Cohnella sp.]